MRNRMRSIRLRRALSVLVMLTLVTVFQLPFTQEADAASGAKTYYLPTKITYTSTYDGKKTTSSTSYTYDKHGLRKSSKTDAKEASEISRGVYKRNSSGMVTSVSYYSKKGKKTGYIKCTVKKGKITKQQAYSVKGKKKTLLYTQTYTYSGNKLKKSVLVDKAYGTKTTDTYKKGIIAKSETKGKDFEDTITYDSRGNIIKSEFLDDGYKSVSNIKLTYNKKGDITKEVETTTITFDGEKEKNTVTTTFNYKYNSAGKVTKMTGKTSYTDEKGKKITDSFTTKIQYKKVKIAKKYQKAANNDATISFAIK